MNDSRPKMPVNKWILQFTLITAALFIIFALTQYLKGRDADYAVEFGMTWSLITATIYTATRVYYFKRGMYCKVCNDVSAETKPENEKPQD